MMYFLVLMYGALAGALCVYWYHCRATKRIDREWQSVIKAQAVRHKQQIEEVR